MQRGRCCTASWGFVAYSRAKAPFLTPSQKRAAHAIDLLAVCIYGVQVAKLIDFKAQNMPPVFNTNMHALWVHLRLHPHPSLPPQPTPHLSKTSYATCCKLRCYIVSRQFYLTEQQQHSPWGKCRRPGPPWSCSSTPPHTWPPQDTDTPPGPACFSLATDRRTHPHPHGGSS